MFLFAMVRMTAAALSIMLLFPVPFCRAEEGPLSSRPIRTVVLDFKNYYLAPSNLLPLGIGIAVDAVPANTNIDRWIRDKYRNDLRSGGTDDIARIAKAPGSAVVTVPVFAGAYGIGLLTGNPTLKEWSERSFRATIVGTPALLILERGLGSGRPEDGNSHWRPFHAHEGASGHAYFGAIPFLTAAEMSENPYWKGLLYGISALPGLSRINDDAHYFSQVSLGWYLAYLSCRVVSKGIGGDAVQTKIGLAPVQGGMAVTFLRVF